MRRQFPSLFLLLRRLRYSLRPERPDPRTAGIIRALCGDDPRVISGPFRGMAYLTSASGSGLLPKIAGSYELELHDTVEESLERSYDRVLNVGAAEGYYAVGYALRLARAQVFAFDTDVVARYRIRQLARLNDVADRIRVRPACSPHHLSRLVTGRCLVICDCEGCEYELLDPERAPALARADLLVELHEFRVPGVTRLFLQRFEPTHRTVLLDMQDRSDTELDALTLLSAEDKSLALWEGRPPGMQWAWARSEAW